jgi:type 2A phosphatase activator TIP41
VSKIKDYQSVNYTSDWTFSTPYKGTVRYLQKAAKSIRDFTGLEISTDVASQKKMELKVVPEAAIPFEMLSPDNPILHFGEVFLFESDLEDCGYTMSKVRFRVMKDCFYVLLRYYLRVDGVRVRIYDTRIFH